MNQVNVLKLAKLANKPTKEQKAITQLEQLIGEFRKYDKENFGQHSSEIDISIGPDFDYIHIRFDILPIDLLAKLNKKYNLGYIQFSHTGHVVVLSEVA